MAIFVLDPKQEAIDEEKALHKPAPLLSTLTGKTVGLFNNKKLNASKLVELTCEELQKEYSFDVVRGTYSSMALVPDDDWGPDIDKCDVVLLANGDCGSCSSSGIANAIQLQKRGIAAMLISTKPFFGVIKTMSEVQDMPDVQFAVIEHPVGRLEEEALHERAKDAARQFREKFMTSVPLSPAG